MPPSSQPENVEMKVHKPQTQLAYMKFALERTTEWVVCCSIRSGIGFTHGFKKLPSPDWEISGNLGVKPGNSNVC